MTRRASRKQNTFFWYDYETFGRDAQSDRIAQFAGLRTDENLNIVGQPTVAFCKLSNDYLPHPEACLVHGLSPQEVNEKGIPEVEFAKLINSLLGKPDTCAVGYNSIEFDDEFTRNLLYRNLFDPYAREWKHGCSRWDMINVVRLTAALRPAGIVWPKKPCGKPSFRLEDLAAANDLQVGSAHDALADVQTTIALANLLRNRQPRLLQYCYTNRNKAWLKDQLNVLFKRPVLHVDQGYGSAKNYMTVVVPLAKHPNNENGVIVYDLSVDPQPLFDLTPEEIRERVFSKNEVLEERGETRIPLRTVVINRYPVMAEYSALRDKDAERLGIDRGILASNLKAIKKFKRIGTKMRSVFTPGEMPEITDPDLMIYQGSFLSREDRLKLESVRATPSDKLATLKTSFADERLPEMLFRFRARNYPETLSQEEITRWDAFRKQRLETDDPKFLDIWQYRNRIKELLSGDVNQEQDLLLRKMLSYEKSITESLA